VMDIRHENVHASRSRPYPYCPVLASTPHRLELDIMAVTGSAWGRSVDGRLRGPRSWVGGPRGGS
jgi:hypothetical protein